MPVGDLSALNISRHGWFTVYIELRRDAALFSFEAEHCYARYDKQTADDSGGRGNFAKHSKTHGGRQKGRQELKIGNVTGF